MSVRDNFAQVTDGFNKNYYGVANPKYQVSVRTFVESHISRILVNEGQKVKAGEVIIELDAREAVNAAQVARLEAEATGRIINADAEVTYAQANFQRKYELFQKNALNKDEMQQATLRLEVARANLKMERERIAANRARYELAKTELDRYFIRAPFDGRIEYVNASPGQMVTEADDLLTIVALDKFRVELYLPPRLAEKLVVGKNCRMNFESSRPQIVNGIVVFRSPVIESATNSVRFVIEIDNPDGKLPAGVSVFLADDPGLALQ